MADASGSSSLTLICSPFLAPIAKRFLHTMRKAGLSAIPYGWSSCMIQAAQVFSISLFKSCSQTPFRLSPFDSGGGLVRTQLRTWLFIMAGVFRKIFVHTLHITKPLKTSPVDVRSFAIREELFVLPSMVKWPLTTLSVILLSSILNLEQNTF